MALPASLAHVVIDVADGDDLDAVLAFWATVLGVEVALRWKQYALLGAAAPGVPTLSFQRVAEPKLAKNRVHLDLHVDDPEAAVAEIVAVGGRFVRSYTEDGVTVWVCTDPAGNEFCLLRPPV